MKKTVFILTAALAITSAVPAQFTIKNISDWGNVKNGTTYVLLDSLTSPQNEAFEALFKQYWKVSTVKFIDTKDFEKYLSPNASYLSLVTVLNPSTTTQPAMGGPGFGGTGMSRSLTLTPITSCRLWTCNAKYFKKKKDWNVDDMNIIVTSDIWVETEEEAMAYAYNNKVPSYKALRKEEKYGTSSKANLEREDVNKFQTQGGLISGVGGEVQNVHNSFWGVGALKNYIQVLNALIAAHKNGKATINRDALKKLNTDTLYVPEDIIQTKHYTSNMTGTKLKETKTKPIMSGYKLNYASITKNDLNNKIINAQADFYYFGYNGDYVYVMDGLTGELAYAKEINEVKGMDSKIMKKLYTAILK